MANGVWEKTGATCSDSSFMSTIVRVITLGIADNPNKWEVEFTNKKTGERVIGTGSTEEEAEDQARLRTNVAVAV